MFKVFRWALAWALMAAGAYFIIMRFMYWVHTYPQFNH